LKIEKNIRIDTKRSIKRSRSKEKKVITTTKPSKLPEKAEICDKREEKRD